MNVGFVGLGKLGLPVATCIALKGHNVYGYDIDSGRMSKLAGNPNEAGLVKGGPSFVDYLRNVDSLFFVPLEEVAEKCDLIFVAVQTPHDFRYEGITPLPDIRKDFSYDFLEQAIKDLVKVVRPNTLIVVISTCLPGTMRKRILPLLPDGVQFAYNPFFIAMGTVMQDFLNPEFILVGAEDKETIHRLESFYRTITNAPVRGMSIESAELTKVAYNTFISFKICFANTIMEICDKFPEADVDDVTDALKSAYRRLISPAYLTGGMGDGGACHPRDNIAMSWLAKEYSLSFDLFEAIMLCREKQAKYIADIANAYAKQLNLPVVVYGYAFKPNTDMAVGSAALLMTHFLEREAILWDPLIDTESKKPNMKAIYILGCKHSGVERNDWPKGSVVIDPFRVTKEYEVDGVQYIRLGEGVQIHERLC